MAACTPQYLLTSESVTEGHAVNRVPEPVGVVA